MIIINLSKPFRFRPARYLLIIASITIKLHTTIFVLCKPVSARVTACTDTGTVRLSWGFTKWPNSYWAELNSQNFSASV
jgi:hypothetical protein